MNLVRRVSYSSTLTWWVGTIAGGRWYLSRRPTVLARQTCRSRKRKLAWQQMPVAGAPSLSLRRLIQDSFSCSPGRGAALGRPAPLHPHWATARAGHSGCSTSLLYAAAAGLRIRQTGRADAGGLGSTSVVVARMGQLHIYKCTVLAASAQNVANCGKVGDAIPFLQCCAMPDPTLEKVCSQYMTARCSTLHKHLQSCTPASGAPGPLRCGPCASAQRAPAHAKQGQEMVCTCSVLADLSTHSMGLPAAIASEHRRTSRHEPKEDTHAVAEGQLANRPSLVVIPDHHCRKERVQWVLAR